MEEISIWSTNNSEKNKRTRVAIVDIVKLIIYSRQLCKPSTSSRVCINVSNSPNPSRVYIRLCKHGKRFLLLKRKKNNNNNNNNNNNSAIIVDIASPWDHRVYEKEGEKIEKYQDLKREIGRLWGIRHLEVVPVVVGALEVVNNRLDAWLEKLGVTIRTRLLQKTALLGTARILRKLLES